MSDPRRPTMAVRVPRGIEPTEAALAATRLAGCTCEPHMHIEVVDKTITFVHDHDCPLVEG